jgi:hypothetical protein
LQGWAAEQKACLGQEDTYFKTLLECPMFYPLLFLFQFNDEYLQDNDLFRRSGTGQRDAKLVGKQYSITLCITEYCTIRKTFQFFS